MILSGEVDEYEYLVGEEILPLEQSRLIGRAQFTSNSLTIKKKKKKNLHENLLYNEGNKLVEALQSFELSNWIKEIQDHFPSNHGNFLFTID